MQVLRRKFPLSGLEMGSCGKGVFSENLILEILEN